MDQGQSKANGEIENDEQLHSKQHQIVQNAKNEISGNCHIFQGNQQINVLYDIFKMLRELEPNKSELIKQKILSSNAGIEIEEKYKELCGPKAQKNRLEQTLLRLQNKPDEYHQKLQKLKNNYEQPIKTLQQSHQKELNKLNNLVQQQKKNTKQEVQKRQTLLRKLEQEKNDILNRDSRKDQEIKKLNDKINVFNREITIKDKELESLRKNNSDQQKSLNNAKSEIQKLRTSVKELEDSSTKLTRDLIDIYKTIPQDKKNNQVSVNKASILQAIKNNIEELNTVRSAYKNIQGDNSNNFIEATKKVLQFWKNYNKIVPTTIKTLDLISKGKVKVEEFKSFMKYRSDFIENFAEGITKMNQQIILLQKTMEQNEQKFKKQLAIEKNQKQNFKQQCRVQLKKKSEKIQQLQNNNKKLEQNMKQEIIKLKSQLKQMNQKFVKQQQQKRKKIYQIQQLKQNISSLQKKRNELEGKISELQNEIIKLKETISDLQRQKNELIRNVRDLQSNIRSLDNKLKAQQIQKKEWQSKYQGQKRQHDDLKQKHTREVNEHQQTKQKTQTKINSLQRDIIGLKDQITTLQREISTKKKQILSLSDKLNITERQLENAIKKGKKAGDVFSYVIKKTCGYDVSISIDQLDKASQQCFQAIMSKNFVSGSYAMERLSIKSITTLINIIERKRGRNVKGLKLVYKYDNLNTLNFHKYIDDKNDLLMISRLANEYVVGGYTHQPINKLVTPGIGFIFSFSEARDIILEINSEKSSARVVSPQDYQAIFGNSELRINPNDTDLFCNVGILNENFNANSQNIKVTDFIGTRSREQKSMKMQTYEFYQVQFD